jgi:hypothetical protein
MLQAPLMIRKTALSALHDQPVLFVRWYPWFSHSVTPFIKDIVKCSHSSIQNGSKVLAFPSYNYEGNFMREQVVELKSAYHYLHITQGDNRV